MDEHRHRFMTMLAPDGYTDEVCSVCLEVRWTDRQEVTR